MTDTVLSVVFKKGELVAGDMLNGASHFDQMLIEECIRKLIEKSAFKKQNIQTLHFAMY